MDNSQSFGTTEIFGVPIACVDLAGLFDQVANAIEHKTGTPYFLTYANAHTMNTIWEQKAFKQTIKAYNLVYADGVGVTLASRLLGGCQLVKMTGADWIIPFARLCAEKGWRVYLLGGKPGVAEKAAYALTKEFPTFRIAGVSDGYFSDEKSSLIRGAIEIAHPDVVLVGMGSPKQETWARSNFEDLPVPVVWCVGALFDYLAGTEQRAPEWMLKLGLEWLGRLLVDPLGKWRRYIIGNPKFLFRVFRSGTKRGR